MPTEHNPETGSTSLKRMILGQAMEATAIPMVLFSSDTLAGGDGPDAQPDRGRARRDRAGHRPGQPAAVLLRRLPAPVGARRGTGPVTRWTPAHSAALTRTPIVALNFHEITADHRTEVRRSLRHVAGLGPRYDPDESGPADGPRVFVAFYDGMRDAALFGAEECANLGLKAYFFPLFDHYDPELANVTDDEWRQIATVHEIGFHTAGHAAVTEVTPRTVASRGGRAHGPDRGDRRLPAADRRLEGRVAVRPGLVGDQTARAYGMRFLVSNWSIERVPLGARPGR